LRYYNLALPLQQQVGNKGGEAAILNNMGTAYSSLGEKEEALHYYNLALLLVQKVGDRWHECTALANLSRLHLGQGQRDAAAYAGQAVALACEIGHPKLAEYEALLAEVEGGGVG